MNQQKPLLLILIALALVLPAAAQTIPDGAMPPLPTAQFEAPVNPVPAETLATYQSGAFLEGVAIDTVGDLYITSTFFPPDEEFSPSSTGEARILKVTADGELSEFARPLGGFAGVIVYAGDEFFMTASSPAMPEWHGVQRMSSDGEFEMFATLPPDAMPNGITLLPDGDLLVADSALGVLHRIARDTGAVSTWIDAPDMLKPNSGFYPGANGVQVHDGIVYVTVPDRLAIVRIPILADSGAGTPQIHAEGIAGDDFSIDSEGNLYVTTHPFNTVTKVFPDGSMETIASVEQNIVGSTATVFGNQPGDETGLYVVTDGGLFEVLMGMRDAPLEPHIVRLETGTTEQSSDSTANSIESITFEQPGIAPEGIEYDAENDHFLVGSLTQGTIFRVTATGESEPFITDEALMSTGGIHIDHLTRRLLVTNINGEALSQVFSGTMPESTGASLVIYDLDTRERLAYTDLSQFEAADLNAVNDVTTDSDGNAYVTNSFAPVIYRVTPDGTASIFVRDDRLDHPVFGLNGIDYHPDGYLLAAVSGQGALFKIPVDNPDALTRVQLETGVGMDGLILADENTLYAVGIVFPEGMSQLQPTMRDIRLIRFESQNNWGRATTVASVALEPGFTTVTLVESRPYAINAGMPVMNADATPPRSYRIAGFNLLP